jgi:hypothetical protein
MSPTLSLAVPDPSVSALYVPGLSLISQGRAVMQIGNGQLQNWYQPLFVQTYRPGFNIPGSGGTPLVPTIDSPKSNIWSNAANADAYDRASFVSTGWTNNSFLTNLGNYRYPGVTDRSIYDWKNDNILQADYGFQKNQNYEFDFEQEITSQLYLSGGWFRQDFKQTSNYTIGQLNATALRIDENKYLPNGTPNPYFGCRSCRIRTPTGTSTIRWTIISARCWRGRPILRRTRIGRSGSAITRSSACGRVTNQWRSLTASGSVTSALAAMPPLIVT